MATESDLEALYQTPVTLDGKHVKLLPLTLEHGEALFGLSMVTRDLALHSRQAAGNTCRHAGLGGDCAGGANGKDGASHCCGGARQRTARSSAAPVTMNMSYPNRNLDVGWTWYAAETLRTAGTQSCKFLLLRYAFETLRCIRVQLRVDLRNLRSQRAVERIGGIKEECSPLPGSQRSACGYHPTPGMPPGKAAWPLTRWRGWGGFRWRGEKGASGAGEKSAFKIPIAVAPSTSSPRG